MRSPAGDALMQSKHVSLPESSLTSLKSSLLPQNNFLIIILSSKLGSKFEEILFEEVQWFCIPICSYNKLSGTCSNHWADASRATASSRTLLPATMRGFSANRLHMSWADSQSIKPVNLQVCWYSFVSIFILKSWPFALIPMICTYKPTGHVK